MALTNAIHIIITILKTLFNLELDLTIHTARYIVISCLNLEDLTFLLHLRTNITQAGLFNRTYTLLCETNVIYVLLTTMM